MNIQELWANRSLRIGLLGVLVLVPGIFFIFDFGESDGLTVRERLELRRQQAEKQTKSTRKPGLFDASVMADIDKEALETVVNQAGHEIQRQQQSLLRERQELESEMAGMQSQLDRSTMELSEVKRQLNLLLSQNRHPQPQGQRRGSLPAGSQNYASGGTEVLGGSNYQGNGLFEQNPTTIVTTAPTITGKVIRNITQRSVSDVRRSGEVTEQAIVHNVISANGTETTEMDSTGKPKAPAKPKAKAKTKKVGTYLPSGSLLSAVLLTGLDAPTAMAAKTSPMPVLMRIKGDTLLPNFYSMDMQDCHAIGSATGNLGTERAEIRLERVSCVDGSGHALDIPVQATAVSDDDGRIGVEGTLVQKNGNILARVMAAEFMAGFANAAAPNRITQFNSGSTGDDVWQSLDFGQYTAAGTLQGTGAALNKLSDYYMELADAAHPVISVSPGRKVTFMTLTGTNINLDMATR